MKSDVSAFLDGALEERSSLDLLCRDAEMRRAWVEYQLIGDALRGEGRLAMDVAPAVMAALADEPTVLAPQRQAKKRGVLRYALPLAASVMGIGAVAWVAQSLRPGPAPMLAATAQPASTSQPASAPQALVAAPDPAAAIPAAAESDAERGAQVQPYLFAHQGHSFMGNVQGVAPYVRIVSDAPGPAR